MKQLLLLSLVGGLLPQAAHAQLNTYEPGSYVLADNQQLRLTGQLKLRDSHQLLVKAETGKTLKLSPEQVSSFRLGSRRFSIANEFHVAGGIGGFDVTKPVFVEQLDSGQLVLQCLRFSTAEPGSPNGTYLGGLATVSVYLLRWATDEAPTPVQAGPYSSGGQQFREAVRPFLVGRPELLELLDEKRIGESDIPALVQSLNTNTPFTPTQ